MRNKLIVMFIVVMFMLIVGILFSQDKPMAIQSWDANTESDLGGYFVYVSSSPNMWADSVDVGNKTMFTWKHIVPGETNFYSVKAYDIAGNLSKRSNIFEFTIPVADTTAPAAPTGNKTVIGVTVNININN